MRRQISEAAALTLAFFFCTTAWAKAPRWNGPRETHAIHNEDLVLRGIGFSPVPTLAPRIDNDVFGLVKKQVTENGPDTCGYINGRDTASLVCDSRSVCVENAALSAIGCCPSSNTTCAIWTTCLNREQSALFTTNNGFTMFCQESSFPSCVTHIYGDAFTGSTLYGCGKIAQVDTVFFLPPSVTANTAVSDSTTYQLATNSPNETGSSSSNDDNNGQGGNDETNPNLGAIIGGSIGGAAVLALVLAGIFFLRRREKNSVATKKFGGDDGSSKFGGGSLGVPLISSTYPPQSPGFTHGGYAPSTTGSEPGHYYHPSASPEPSLAPPAYGQYHLGGTYNAGWHIPPSVTPPPPSQHQQHFLAELPGKEKAPLAELGN